MRRARFELTSQADEFAGTYISKEWIQKNVLRQTEEEIKEIANQIRREEADGETIMSPAGTGDAPMGNEESSVESDPEKAEPKEDKPTGAEIRTKDEDR
jgi:hypothetical protein